MALFHRTIVPDTRPLAAQAARDCATIHAASFAHPWSAAEIENLLRQSNVAADAALDSRNAKLLGFVISRLAGDEAEVLTLAIDPALRRKGIATAMLAAHLSRLRNAGVKILFLEVDEQNAAAQALYRRFGFETVGSRPGYYRERDGSRATASILRREID
jgi:ribosomal-protein-alanine N-acetyltransferase